jgi:hypothetical protein
MFWEAWNTFGRHVGTFQRPVVAAHAVHSLHSLNCDDLASAAFSCKAGDDKIPACPTMTRDILGGLPGNDCIDSLQGFFCNRESVLVPYGDRTFPARHKTSVLCTSFFFTASNDFNKTKNSGEQDFRTARISSSRPS